MIKILAATLLILFITGCEKNDKTTDIIEEAPTEFEAFKDGSSTEEIYEYGLWEDGIEFTYPFRSFNADSSLICFTGIKESKVHFECFDTRTKRNLLSWSEEQPADTKVTIDMGYGEEQTFDITTNEVAQFLIKDDTFLLILNDIGNNGLLRSHIFFIKDDSYNKETTIAFSAEKESTVYFSQIVDWYSNSILVLPTHPIDDPNRINNQLYCFNTNGDRIYKSASTPFLILENHYYPLNYYEFIHIAGNSELSFERKNAETCQTLWSTDIPDLTSTSELRIDSVAITQTNTIVSYELNCTHKNGTKQNFIYDIDIETGELITK